MYFPFTQFSWLRKSGVLICALIFSFSLNACSYHFGIRAETDCFWGKVWYGHPNPIVKLPAKAGFYTGADAGGILLAPVFIPALIIGQTSGNKEAAGWSVAAPYAYCAEATGSVIGTITGAPVWLLFGWWPGYFSEQEISLETESKRES